MRPAQLGERLPTVANLSIGQVDWDMAVQTPRGAALRSGSTHPVRPIRRRLHKPWAAHASHLLLLLDRDPPNAWNRYCSVSVEQRTAEGKPIERSRDTIGYRGAGQPMTVLVPFSSGTRRIEIRLQTAFGHEPFLLRQIDCSFLAAPVRSRRCR